MPGMGADGYLDLECYPSYQILLRSWLRNNVSKSLMLSLTIVAETLSLLCNISMVCCYSWKFVMSWRQVMF